MKKLFLIFITIFTPYILFAQDQVVIIEEETNDNPKESAFWKNDTQDYPKKTSFGKIRAHWSGISFGYNGLIQNLGNMQLPEEAKYMKLTGNSVNFNLNLIDVEIISNKNYALVTGLGLEFNTFRFKNNISLTENANGFTVPDYSYNDQGIRLKKSKLSTNYLVIPLLAEFRIGNSPKKAFYIHGGVIGGWCYNAHTKVKYTSLEGHTTKDKTKGLNIPHFRYGYTLGIGFSNIGIFARYYPESIFIPGEGPNVKQVSIGISLNTAGR